MKRTAFLLALCLAAPLAAQAAPQVIIIQERSPAAAGIFSFLIPGAGQVYNGQVGKGLLFFGAGVVTIGFATATDCVKYPSRPELNNCETAENATVWAVAFLVNSVLSITDAVNTSKRLNAEARVRIQPTAAPDGRVGLAVSVAWP